MSDDAMKEPLALYVSALTRDTYKDPLQIITMIDRGVSYERFSKIREIVPFTTEEWADYLGISTKSLRRYELDQRRFKSLQSEKILEATEVSTPVSYTHLTLPTIYSV